MNVIIQSLLYNDADDDKSVKKAVEAGFIS